MNINALRVPSRAASIIRRAGFLRWILHLSPRTRGKASGLLLFMIRENKRGKSKEKSPTQAHEPITHVRNLRLVHVALIHDISNAVDGIQTGTRPHPINEDDP